MALLLVTVLGLAACGGDGEEPQATSPPSPPEGGREEPGGATGVTGAPGAPGPGDPSYSALGSYWLELPRPEREASAAEFIADNPAACEGLDPADLAQQAGLAYSVDLPPNVPAADALLETCALLRDGG